VGRYGRIKRFKIKRGGRRITVYAIAPAYRRKKRTIQRRKRARARARARRFGFLF
jgi:hypothetical protein